MSRGALLFGVGAGSALLAALFARTFSEQEELNTADGGSLAAPEVGDPQTNGDQPALPPFSDLSPVVGDLRLPRPAPAALRLEFLSLAGTSPGTGTDYQFVPGSTDILMTLREGKLAWVRLHDRRASTLRVWPLTEKMVIEDACGPSNLLLDPKFSNQGFIYITYCASPTKNRLVRYQFDFESGPSEPRTILEIDAPSPELWRRFGSMGWEDEDTLWLLVGDHALPERAQDPTSLEGALVRIKPKRGAGGGYDLPPRLDWGPAWKVGARSDAVYAYGFRAPFRGTRDQVGRFFVADVGEDDFEEINLVSEAGQNFGWDLYSGPCEQGCSGAVGPLTFYGRSDEHAFVVEEPGARPNASRSIWVGQIYEAPSHDRYAGLMDAVVPFGDMFTGMIRGLKVDRAGQLIQNEPIGALSFVTQWRVGPDGYVYVLDLGGNMHVALLAGTE